MKRAAVFWIGILGLVPSLAGHASTRSDVEIMPCISDAYQEVLAHAGSPLFVLQKVREPLPKRLHPKSVTIESAQVDDTVYVHLPTLLDHTKAGFTSFLDANGIKPESEWLTAKVTSLDPAGQGGSGVMELQMEGARHPLKFASHHVAAIPKFVYSEPDARKVIEYVQGDWVVLRADWDLIQRSTNNRYPPKNWSYADPTVDSGSYPVKSLLGRPGMAKFIGLDSDGRMAKVSIAQVDADGLMDFRNPRWIEIWIDRRALQSPVFSGRADLERRLAPAYEPEIPFSVGEGVRFRSEKGIMSAGKVLAIDGSTVKVSEGARTIEVDRRKLFKKLESLGVPRTVVPAKNFGGAEKFMLMPESPPDGAYREILDSAARFTSLPGFAELSFEGRLRLVTDFVTSFYARSAAIHYAEYDGVKDLSELACIGEGICRHHVEVLGNVLSELGYSVEIGARMPVRNETVGHVWVQVTDPSTNGKHIIDINSQLEGARNRSYVAVHSIESLRELVAIGPNSLGSYERYELYKRTQEFYFNESTQVWEFKALR